MVMSGFGKKIVLFVGDLLQLPPVSAKHVFDRITTESLLFLLGCATSVNIWRDSVANDDVTINKRHRKGRVFINV